MRAIFLFPGQGSQSVGMGKEFYDSIPAAREILETASQKCEIDFKELLFSENEKLGISEFTQPAIVLNSFMAYLALKERLNLEPVLSLGHSLGEFSALAVSGGIEIYDALNLVRNRGKFMQESCEGKNAGMMVVLGLLDEKVEAIVKAAADAKKSVWAANYNCDGQIVIAGDKADLASLESEFKSNGAKRAMLLNMSVASHCPMLKSASEKLSSLLETALKSSFAPVLSNATAEIYTEKSQALELLKSQLVSPVLYKQSIKKCEEKCDCFVEFGASVLKGINKKITQIPTFSITNLADIEEFLKFAKENG